MFSINKNRSIMYISCFIFFLLLVFFIKIHPYIPFSGDDWRYVGIFRTPVPKIGGWNPCRVFPEYFLPIIESFSVYVFYPIFDYVRSISIGYAISISCFISLFFYFLCVFIKSFFQFNNKQSTLIGVIFLILSFLSFKSSISQNYYLFYATSITHGIFYTISSLLNTILLLYVMAKRLLRCKMTDQSYLGKGVFGLIVYFAVFSNLYSNMILFSYSISALIYFYLLERKNSNFLNTPMHYKNFFRKYKLEFYLAGLWILTGILETTGGDAKKLTDNLPIYVFPFSELFKNLSHLFSHINILFWGLLAGIIFIGGFIYFRKQNCREDTIKSLFVINAMSAIVSFFILIILISKTGVDKALYIHVFYPFFIYIFLEMIFVFSYIVKQYQALFLLLPFILLIFVGYFFKSIPTYADANKYGLSSSTIYEISNDMIQDIKAARDGGKDTIVVVVPKGELSDNWPIPYYLKYSLPETLYNHGIIDSDNIKITILPSKNEDSPFLKNKNK